MPALRRLRSDIRVLSRQQALRLGFSRSDIDYRLRAGLWWIALPQIYFAVTEPRTRDRLRAVLLHAGDAAVISGGHGLRLHQVACEPGARILALTERRMKQRRNDWMHIRPTERLPRPTWCDGIALAPPARCVADWSLQSTSLMDVRAVVTRAVQDELCSVQELQLELDAGSRNGSARLRQALAEIAGGSRSAPEAEAARLLTAAGLGGFQQNVAIGRYVVDFLWPELGAILEIDSAEFHYRRDDWASTLTRHRELESWGYSVIHIRPAELRNPHAFVAAVRRWLAGRRVMRTSA